MVDVDCVCRGTGITDCNAVEFGTAWPGTPCDDGDPLTTTEVWSPNCICTVPAIACDGVPFGYQNTASWQAFINWMRAQDVLSQPQRAVDALTNDLLPTDQVQPE